MEYEKFLELNKEEMIFALQRLLRCSSQEGEKIITKEGEVYPFGQGVQQALETALEIAEDMGFVTKNVDNYGAHIDFPGTGAPEHDKKGNVVGFSKPKVMAVIGHLDVVPAGGDWEFDPYGGDVADGRIYGRGTTDDKGPVVSCLYAMKALKDSGYKPVNTIRLIIGLDEETHWKGMDYYFSKVEKPDFGFTPDADFPIINGEMGLLIFDLAKKFGKTQVKGLELRSIKGGTAPNSVADSCRCVVRSQDSNQYAEIKEKVAHYREASGHKINCKGVGKSFEITTAGIAAHGAKPEKGLNAISIMMEFLGGLNFVCEDHNDFIDFYNKYIGFNLDGKGLGIDLEDEPSGKLIFNVGMIDMEPEAGKFTINIRYPVTAADEEIFDGMEEMLNKYNFGLVKTEHRKPIYLELNNPMVKDLLEIYRKHTGDTESQPLVIGGGTYARSADNIVAYGAMFPGDPDLMHQKNEFLEIEKFELMTKIYAEAIYKLSQGDYNS